MAVFPGTGLDGLAQRIALVYRFAVRRPSFRYVRDQFSILRIGRAGGWVLGIGRIRSSPGDISRCDCEVESQTTEYFPGLCYTLVLGY